MNDTTLRDEATRIGMLTPSSNTALEPLCSAIVAGLPEVSMHFSRFRVVQISLNADSRDQFDDGPILRAAELLADARVHAIAWNGTSSGWLGFDTDERLCERIRAATGIPATSSVLALNELLTLTGARRIGLVTPYLDEVQELIVANYGRSGFDVVAERHLGDRGNFSFALYGPETLRGMVRAVAQAKPDAITTFCTNLKAAQLVDALERETGIPVLDTVSTAVWKTLSMTGIDPARVQGWGRMFAARAAEGATAG